MTETSDEASGTRDSDVGWDGFITGALGAVTVALWFLVLDLAAGHPLHTPTLLGNALFGGGAGPVQHADPGTVMRYSGVHLAVYVLVGTGLSWLAARFRGRRLGLPLLVAALALVEVGFYVLLLVFAAPVAEALSGWSVLVGNLLAAVAMGYYLLLRYPALLGGAGGRGAAGGGG